MVIPWWKTQVWFPLMNKTTGKLSCATPTKHLNFAMEQINATPIVPKNEIVGHSVFRQAFRNTSIPPEIANVITDLWRTATKSRYESVLRRWAIYATSRNADPYIADVNTVLGFLHGMYLNGCLYRGLCAACSALSSVATINGFVKLSEHPFISRYLKGIYNRHPVLPKYCNTWDMSLLLKYYNSIDNYENLQFKDLLKNTVVLFMILGARRKQALFTITVDDIVVEENKIVLLPNKTLKHTNTCRPLEPLIYHRYRANNKLCIVECVNFYLGVWEKLVDANVMEFIITYGKPLEPASSDTISPWIKDEFGKAGITTNVYTAHS